MYLVLSIVLFVHGVAHLVGFVVPWKLATMDDAPYRTTLLSGRIEVGDAGIRAVGLVWLLLAVAFVVSAASLLLGPPWWYGLTVGTVSVSLVLSVLGWPDSKYGVPINVVLLAVLVGAVLFGYPLVPPE